MTETTINTDIQNVAAIDKAWDELGEFAQGCIHWGESDIDKKKFIEDGKQFFDIAIKQKKSKNHYFDE